MNKKIVIKIGSSLILENKTVNLERLNSLSQQIAELKKMGYQIILVSSGAIALGREKIGFSQAWPDNLAGKQALAAIGQPELMTVYKKLFAKENLIVAQILLTREDVADWQKYLNVKKTLDVLLKKGVIPIINENDSTATEEIQFGDNDTLSALITSRTAADLLIILSDIDGLYYKQKIIKQIKKITPAIEALAQPSKKRLTRGGMKAKIQAAKISLAAGIPVIIANGKRKNILLKLMAGEKLGTKFIPQKKIKLKKNWLLFGGLTKGELVVDKGAEKAIKDEGSSLLPIGIKKVKGDFAKMSLVKIINENNQEFAKGISAYDSQTLKKIIRQLAGKKKPARKEAIHRDNLVLLT